MQIPSVTFCSFRDVEAALAAPALSLDRAPRPGVPTVGGTTRESVSGGEVARLVPSMRSSAQALVRSLETDETVDLVASFAEPWSRELALAYATGEARPSEASDRLLRLAREVFLEAAHATSRSAVTAPSDALRTLVHMIGRERSPFTVQGFVALAGTLPLLLAGAWHALVIQRGAWRALRRTPAPRIAAIEELVRLASPARAVFRRAVTDVTVGTTRVAAGDDIILALHAANRCPERFADPERFVADRFAADVAGRRHVGLGLSPHACAGGALVRVALDVATSALLDAFDDAVLAGPVTRLGGFAIDGITALPVTLQHRRDGEGMEGACPR